MSRLKKNRLFGLYISQMRSRGERVVKNSGWYNKAGEKLGWGDLSADDFKKICQGLKGEELFIILNETDSFWNFVTDFGPGPKGDTCKTKLEIKAPGVDYVSSKCMFIISNKSIYFVDNLGVCKGKDKRNYRGLQCKIISREKAQSMIKRL